MLQRLGVLVVVALISCVSCHSEINDVQVLATKALDRTAFKYIDSIEGITAEQVAFFEDTNNVLVCSQSDTLILHITKLNSAAQYAGLGFQQWGWGQNQDLTSVLNSTDHGNFDMSRAWLELRRESMNLVSGNPAPMTGCLDCQRGGTGVLSGKHITTVGRTLTLDILHGFSIFLTLGLSYSFEFASALTISATFSCTVPAGKVGQVFLQPFYVRFSNPELRVINVLQNWWRRATPEDLVIGEWNRLDRAIDVVSHGTKPILLCVTDPLHLDCDGKLTPSDFY